MSTAGAATAPPGPTGTVRYPQPWTRIFAAAMYGAVLAAFLCTDLYLLMRLVGVPMEAVRSSGGAPGLVGFLDVIGACLLAGVGAAVVAGLLRRSPNGPRIVVLIGTVVFLVSIAAAVLQPDVVPTATRVCLIVLNTVTYLVVVWFTARGATPEDPPPAAKARFGIA